MPYLLDTNVFIAAKDLYYGMDFCPAFWDWIILSNQSKRVFSIEKVGDELAAVGDELAEWAAKRGPEFYLKPDPEMLTTLAIVSNWVTAQKYTAAAVNIFLQAADYYLISYALAHKYIVVTHEKPADTPNKVKIPNVCIGLGVKFMNAFEMLKHERARFVIETPK